MARDGRVHELILLQAAEDAAARARSGGLDVAGLRGSDSRAPRDRGQRDRGRRRDLVVVRPVPASGHGRSEEHTSELQSRLHLVCRLLLEKKKKNQYYLVVHY